jgi:hypothetical protein
LHGRPIQDLNEEKIEENGSYVMNEEVEDVVAYRIKLTDSIIDCQAQVGSVRSKRASFLRMRRKSSYWKAAVKLFE